MLSTKTTFCYFFLQNAANNCLSSLMIIIPRQNCAVVCFCPLFCSHMCHIYLVSLIMLQLLQRSQYCVVCFCLVLYFSLWHNTVPPPHVYCTYCSNYCVDFDVVSSVYLHCFICLILMQYFLYRFSYNKILKGGE